MLFSLFVFYSYFYWNIRDFHRHSPDVIYICSVIYWILHPKLFDSEQIGHGEGEDESDIFTIREVSFQPEGEEDWKETSYTLNTDSLDWVCLCSSRYDSFKIE